MVSNYDAIPLFLTVVWCFSRLRPEAQALDDAWDEIEKSGSEFARPAYANATREEIAKHMLEVAGRGERDRHILAEDAVRFLAENYKY